jgi:citrate lyase beta subunit
MKSLVAPSHARAINRVFEVGKAERAQVLRIVKACRSTPPRNAC